MRALDLRRRIVMVALLAGAAAGASVSGLLGPSECRAAEKSGPRIESIRIGVGGVARVGVWTPVWVSVAGGSTAFEGDLVVTAPDDDGTAVEFRQPVRLSAGERIEVEAYVRLGQAESEILTQLWGRKDGAASVALGPPVRTTNAPRVLGAEDRVILSIGNTHGLDDVATIVDRAATELDAQGRLEIVRLEPGAMVGGGGLPGQWYGLELASTLVVDLNDPNVRAALPAHDRVIGEWVRNGGHVVVAGAEGLVEPGVVPDELLPARVVGLARLNDLGAIEAFAGTTTNPIPARAMDVARLEVPTVAPGEPVSRILGGSGELPLVVRAGRGFGRVTLVGLNVDQPPFSEWKDRALFWTRALDLRVAAGAEDSLGGTTSGELFGSVEKPELSGTLHSLLDQPPGVGQVSFGWVAFLIFLYIILIGPIDYLFLKHVARRMELTWLSFPLIVVATTAAAYLGAYALKGRDLRAVKLDTVDVEVATGRVRGQSFLTVYSPANQDYGITFEPTEVTTAGVAPGVVVTDREAGSAATGECLVSWFAPPVPRLGGGGAGALAPLARPYAYGPPGELQQLAPVRIPIWSTKSFEARWRNLEERAAGVPLIEADLMATSSNRVEGRITNNGPRALERAVLFFEDQVYDQIGTIPPGGSVVIDSASRTRPISGYLEERARGFLNSDGQLRDLAGDSAGVRGTRLSDLARTLLFREGMNPQTRTPPSTLLRHLDLTGQLALGRPMLVADVDGPGATSVLLGADDRTPKVVERTVVRLILELQGESF